MGACDLAIPYLGLWLGLGLEVRYRVRFSARVGIRQP